MIKMCNRRFELGEWMNLPCEKCGINDWVLVVRSNVKASIITQGLNIDGVSAIKCNKCKTEYCWECGDTMEINSMEHDKLKIIRRTPIETILKLQAKFEELDLDLDMDSSPSQWKKWDNAMDRLSNKYDGHDLIIKTLKTNQ